MIKLVQVNIHQGDFRLTDIAFQIEQGQYAILMGPTGCGKTTVLEAICGLRRVKSGQIFVDGRDVTRCETARREIGFVPQESSLFPTMRIDKQIEYGLLMRRATTKLRQQRVEHLAELAGITHLLGRYPKGLSGGERQRVALARALSFRPKLLCLDEPLSALDDDTRERIADLLKTIHQQEQISVLHITHNAQDAAELGTAQYRFDSGRIIRSDLATTHITQ